VSEKKPSAVVLSLRRMSATPANTMTGVDLDTLYSELVIFLDLMEDSLKEDVLAVAGLERLRLLLPAYCRRHGVKP